MTKAANNGVTKSLVSEVVDMRAKSKRVRRGADAWTTLSGVENESTEMRTWPNHHIARKQLRRRWFLKMPLAVLLGSQYLKLRISQ